MLTIRTEQMVNFSEAALKSFEDRMLPFLASNFPDQSRTLGEPRVRLLVRFGISQARKYGIDRERDVCQYIALMFVFGGNFDMNSELPAMQAVLNNPRLTDSSERMRALNAAANIELRNRVNRTEPNKT